MTFLQYISRTVYRYYTNLLLNFVPAAFTRRSAIILRADFRNPKTLSNMDLRNPKTLTKGDMRNPKTLTNADMQIRTAV